MTYDTARYTISFRESKHSPEAFRAAPREALSSHLSLDSFTVDRESEELRFTVSGDAYILPVYEAETMRCFPDDVTVSCDVEIGGGR